MTTRGGARSWPLRLSLLFLLLLIGAPAASAQPGACQFSLGFKALHDLIPQIVGDCVSDEWHDPATGDALQLTANGMLAWRKADNWTAFTNGSTTWLNGPQGLQSRPNSETFPWEGTAAPSSQPAAPPVPSAPVVSPPQPAAPTTAPAPGSDRSGPIRKDPAEVALGLGDVGKEINQDFVRTGSDNRGNWAESRFVRGEEKLNQRLGPLKIFSRVVIANSVSLAQEIYREEVGKQNKMPESEDRLGQVYVNEGKDAVAVVGDEQDSRAACNVDCNSPRFDKLHQRTVMRYQNAVVVLYFYGERFQASPAQMDEWLGKLRERLD